MRLMSHLIDECPRCDDGRLDRDLLGHLLLDHLYTVREAMMTLVHARLYAAPHALVVDLSDRRAIALG
jgi:hypothetical protein